MQSIITKAAISLPKLGASLYQKLPSDLKQLLSQPLLSKLTELIQEQEDIDFFENKILKLCISDWQHEDYFTFEDGKIKVAPTSKPDVTFSGDLASFVALTTQSKDPDTLFFQRKLSITGDTELGLEIKALFENLELNKQSKLLSQPLNFLDRQLNG